MSAPLGTVRLSKPFASVPVTYRVVKEQFRVVQIRDRGIVRYATAHVLENMHPLSGRYDRREECNR